MCGRGKIMDISNTLNEVLVRLFRDINTLEERAIRTEEYKDVTANDMHVIEAIGLNEDKNMSAVAKKLSITMGSLTTAVNHLVKKQYVERSRSEEDRRVVFLKLTEKGVAAYRHHEEYHRQMTEAVLARLDESDMPIVMKVLDAVNDFFKGYGKQNIVC